MDNTRIETQPTVGIETPIIPEASVEVGVTEVPPVIPPEEVLPKEEASAEILESPVGVEFSTETPKPSAGYQIQPGNQGASRIVLEKLTNKIANL